MNSDKPSIFNIFVGFGGAGGKILAEFADHLSRDFEASSRADRDYSFVLVDTDQKELGESSAKIKEKLGRFCANDRLMVKTISLGLPFTNSFVGDLMEKFNKIKASSNSAHMEEVRKTWWMISEDRPFAFAGVNNPNQGASQMPLASRVMTWFNASDIRGAVDKCVKEYKTLYCPNDKPQIDMFFVTSLAGGTGRGCWASLAFMFREAFGELGMQVNPSGIFLDSGCFDNCTDITQMQRPRLRLNSLTGISELLMFLKNALEERDDGRKKQFYQVPSLSNPKVKIIDTTRQAKVKGEFENSRAGDPVDRAVFFFKGNEYVPELTSETLYYRLAGQTLYAMACHGELRSFFVNNNDCQPIGAVSSSVAAVPAEQIMDYIQVLKQKRLAARELEVRQKERSTETEGREQYGFDEKLAAIRSKVGRSAILKAVGEAILSNGQIKNKLAVLAQALVDQNVDAAHEAADSLTQKTPLRDALLAWHEAVCFGETDAVGNWARSEAAIVADGIVRLIFSKQYFLNDNNWERLTLAESLEAIKALKEEWITKKSGDRAASRTVGKDRKQEPDSFGIEVFKDFIDERKGRERYIKGDRFNETERKEINDSARRFVCANNLSALEQEIGAKSADIYKLVDEAEGLIGVMLEDLKTLAERKAKKLTQLKGCFVELKKSSPMTAEYLFHDVTYGTDSRINYVLRPPLTDELEARLNEKVDSELSRGGGQDADRALASQVRRAMEEITRARELVRGAALAECHEKGKLNNEVSILNAIRDGFSDAMTHLECSPEFVRDYFSLQKVVTQYLEQSPIVYEKMNASERGRFAKNISSVFGLDLNSKDRLDVRAAVVNLAAYIAGNCHPFVIIRGQNRQSVDVYMPVIDGWTEEDAIKLFFGSQAAKYYQLKKAEETGSRPTRLHIAEANPFAIMATSAVSFGGWQSNERDLGGIASLDYWYNGQDEQTGKLRDMLLAAEEQGSKNIAIGGRPDLTVNGGIGYVDPCFVYDQNWASLRWRPWWSEEEQDRKKQEENSVASKSLLLAYLCLGNAASDKPGRDATVTEQLVEKLKAKGWVMPLLCRSTDSAGWAWKRRVYEQNADGFREGSPNSCSWKTTARMSSLWKMVEAFNALTAKDRNAILAEMSILGGLLNSVDIDASKAQLKALRQTVRDFLAGLIDHEVENNYDDQKDKQETMRKLLDSAANTADQMFTESK